MARRERQPATVEAAQFADEEGRLEPLAAGERVAEWRGARGDDEIRPVGILDRRGEGR